MNRDVFMTCSEADIFIPSQLDESVPLHGIDKAISHFEVRKLPPPPPP